MGFRCKDKYRIKKGETVILLSNHQTDLDPLCIIPLFNKPVFPVATDSIFSGKFTSALLTWLGVISKKKGATDIKTTVKMLDTLKGGGSIFLFPEGNRTYAEFQYYIASTLAKFIKRTGATLILFNLHGGTGVSPRFKHKNRKGRFYGKIKEIITVEEYENMDEGTLFEKIKNGVRVFDSESGEKYKSDIRAEYLERIFFICPVCGKMQTVYSRGSDVFCTHCGKLAEFTEDLHLKPANEKFTFTRLIDWWLFQKKTIREMPVNSGNTAFFDENVELFLSNPYEKRVKICSGNLAVTDEYIKCGEKTFNVKNISNASVISGRKLTFTLSGNDYLIVGNERFNPLKYAFFFNKIDTEMKKNCSDKYFNLGDEIL